MRRLFLLLLIAILSHSGFSQHYYNDIISNQNANENYKALKNAGVKQVKGTSFEADNSRTDNFALQQEFSRNKTILTTTATNTNNITTITTGYYQNDRIVRTSDSLSSLGNVITTVEYRYDASGNLSNITTTSVDQDHDGTTSEEHLWYYKAGGKPDFMLKIKNKTDTVRVEFTLDEKGNVTEENWRYRNRLINTYYYYYNDNNQLTDVVRYNTKAKKLLPDYMLEYTNGRLAQLTQIISGTTNYLVWRYTYNDKGLKQADQLLDKNKQLVGRIEYSYMY